MDRAAAQNVTPFSRAPGWEVSTPHAAERQLGTLATKRADNSSVQLQRRIYMKRRIMALSALLASAANFPSMKSFKYVATLTIAIAGLTAHADATPITYSYIGADFTSGTGPAGFTTSDNITASFTVNNLLAPSMTFNLALIGATMATISNGVYTLPLNGGIVTTDASGNIVGWDFSVDELLADLSIVRLESFRDGAFGGDDAHKFLLDETERFAFNSVSGTWSSGPATVPDQGATLTLICLALVMLLGFKYAQHKSTVNETLIRPCT
jgi:hypothetical protein